MRSQDGDSKSLKTGELKVRSSESWLHPPLTHPIGHPTGLHCRRLEDSCREEPRRKALPGESDSLTDEGRSAQCLETSISQERLAWVLEGN